MGKKKKELINLLKKPYNEDVKYCDFLPNQIVYLGEAHKNIKKPSIFCNAEERTDKILSHMNQDEISNINNLEKMLSEIRYKNNAPARAHLDKSRALNIDYEVSENHPVVREFHRINDECRQKTLNSPEFKKFKAANNKAVYNALKRYHKVASQELDSMYKQALMGPTGDAAMLGSIINSSMKNYNKASGGMTGIARQKAGWGAVAGGMGKAVAKGAILGAGAQVAANAVDNITKPTYEDEYGRRVQASEVLDEMWKEAASTTKNKAALIAGASLGGAAILGGISAAAMERKRDKESNSGGMYKELNRSYVTRNTIPRPSGFRARIAEPENFAYNRKAHSYMNPVGYTDGSFGYALITTGQGRKNQILSAQKEYIDLVADSKKTPEEKQEYDARMKNKIDDFLAAQRKIFAPIKKHKTKKNLLRSLNDDEVALLLDRKEQDAEKVTDNMNFADRVTAQNYYYY